MTVVEDQGQALVAHEEDVVEPDVGWDVVSMTGVASLLFAAATAAPRS